MLALGRIAHDSLLRLASQTVPLVLRSYPFSHGAVHELPHGFPRLIDSYHPSRYNVNTRRLTYAMFTRVIKRACKLAAS